MTVLPRSLVFVVAIGAFLAPRPGMAAPLSLRLTLEPGASLLELPNESAIGSLGGAAFSLGVSDLLWLQVHWDRKDFSRGYQPKQIDAWAASLLYTIDILSVTPFLALGLAQVNVQGAPPFTGQEIAPVLSVGVDVQIWRFFYAGLGARYYAILGSDLLGAPAYTTFALRIGVGTY